MGESTSADKNIADQTGAGSLSIPRPLFPRGGVTFLQPVNQSPPSGQGPGGSAPGIGSPGLVCSFTQSGRGEVVPVRRIGGEVSDRYTIKLVGHGESVRCRLGPSRVTTEVPGDGPVLLGDWQRLLVERNTAAVTGSKLSVNAIRRPGNPPPFDMADALLSATNVLRSYV